MSDEKPEIPASRPEDKGGPFGDGGPAPATSVNGQILDAVKQTNAQVLAPGFSPSQGSQGSGAVGTGIAYQKVAQAAAFAVQDATDYQRNMMSIGMTAQGVIMEMMIKNKANIPIYTPVLALIQEAVAAATAELAAVGTAATAVVTEFPKG